MYIRSKYLIYTFKNVGRFPEILKLIEKLQIALSEGKFLSLLLSFAVYTRGRETTL